MNLQQFKNNPLLAILRGINSEMIEPIVETTIQAGLEFIEITMNTDNAEALIGQMIKDAKGRLTIGAGTILDMKQLHKALDAGATFIVLPTLVLDVVEYCAKNNVPVFPGAFSPQEVLNAWNSGASMVKIFPIKFFGPEYIAQLKGPFNNIEMLACGGITKENIKEYFQKGASAVAFGGEIYKKTWLDEGKYDLIKQNLLDLKINYAQI